MVWLIVRLIFIKDLRMVSIVTWNMNGIRSSNQSMKDVLDSLAADVICLQETKVTREISYFSCFFLWTSYWNVSFLEVICSIFWWVSGFFVGSFRPFITLSCCVFPDLRLIYFFILFNCRWYAESRCSDCWWLHFILQLLQEKTGLLGWVEVNLFELRPGLDCPTAPDHNLRICSVTNCYLISTCRCCNLL